MAASLNLNVVAIVITYKPDLESLERSLRALIPQVDGIVVVDNGSNFGKTKIHSKYFEGITELIELGENFGIAHAQNVGIQWACDRQAKYVLLMDQDSVPADDMVQNLLLAVSELEGNHCDFACVGPSYSDKRHNINSPFVRLENFRFTRVEFVDNVNIVPVDFLISSGCLIPAGVLREVGTMSAEMFIDYVDIEWGKRAHFMGYQSYGVFSAKMSHSLGGEPLTLWGRSIPTHSPLRAYYRFRNAVLLFKQPWATNEWILTEVRRLLFQYVFFTLFLRPRFQYFKMMGVGLWHGIQGKLGKFK